MPNTSKRPLKPHQREATGTIRRFGGCAGVFMAPGTGKTLVAIRYMVMHLPGLVVCRRDDFLTWKTELIEEGYTLDQIAEIDHGDAHEDPLLHAAFNIPWTIVTHDLCRNKRVADFIRGYPFASVAVDESHSIKRMSADRTKSVIKATRHIPKRLALSGSPITNEVLDVFSQCMFIDNGKVFGDNEWKFRKTYYLKSGPGWYPRRNAKDMIAEGLKRISFHVHEDDVLKLPPIRKFTKWAPMTPAQLDAYEQVLKTWELELEDGRVIEYDHVIVQLAKLKQIASGFYYTPEKDAVWLPTSGKLDLLWELLKEPEYFGRKPKVVIWCAHTAEIERIHKESPWKAVKFYGSVRKEKEAARIAFKTDPKVRLFVGQVEAGVGMNELVVADTALYFSRSPKVVSRQQSMRRTRRIGSEHHDVITYCDLCTEGSVDQGGLSALDRGIDFAQAILNAVKKGTPLRKILQTG